MCPLNRGGPLNRGFTVYGPLFNRINGRLQHVSLFSVFVSSIYANLLETEESFYITKEFNSYRICLEHQHGRRFIAFHQIELNKKFNKTPVLIVLQWFQVRALCMCKSAAAWNLLNLLNMTTKQVETSITINTTARSIFICTTMNSYVQYFQRYIPFAFTIEGSRHPSPTPPHFHIFFIFFLFSFFSPCEEVAPFPP